MSSLEELEPRWALGTSGGPQHRRAQTGNGAREGTGDRKGNGSMLWEKAKVAEKGTTHGGAKEEAKVVTTDTREEGRMEVEAKGEKVEAARTGENGRPCSMALAILAGIRDTPRGTALPPERDSAGRAIFAKRRDTRQRSARKQIKAEAEE